MSSNIMSDDLRNIKTEMALYAAMFSLIKKGSFRKITIKGICEEAMISRATFYAHYIDKYDLLRHWLTELWPKSFSDYDNYMQIEEAVNCQLRSNIPVFRNLLNDADNETFGVLFDFILSTLNPGAEKDNREETRLKNTVLSNFYAGGIISYLLWQINNKFPSDVPLMNKYLYEMIVELQSWKPKQR